jgi:hypothetical protein
VKFSVITLGTPAYRAIFLEVAETVYHGLLSMGYDCVLTKRWLQDRRTVLLTPHSIPLLGVMPPPGTILYNLEPVLKNNNMEFFNPTTIAILRKYPVLDYSRVNIERLSKLGVVPPPRWLPIGYAPELTRIPPAAEEDIDVLFYGSVSDRRRAVLDALRDRGLHVEVLSGVYGGARDAFIARSKVVLNVHSGAANMDIFETVRVSYLLANRKAVVSERGDGHEDFLGAVAFADYDELADRCTSLARDHEGRAELAQRGFAIMSARSEADYLRAALADFV